MTADRALTPDDAVVAIRSFPRRFRGVLARPDDDRYDPEEVSRRVGPDGHAAADHLVAADGVLSLLERAIEQARGEDDPEVDAAFRDLASAPTADDTAAVADLLDRFEGTASHAADRVDGVPSDDWGRKVRVAGDDVSLGLLELAQDAVGAVADHLRAAQRTIDAVV